MRDCGPGLGDCTLGMRELLGPSLRTVGPAAQLTAISALSACGHSSVPRFERSGRRPNLLPFRHSRHAGTPRSLASKGRAGGPTYCHFATLDMRALLGPSLRKVGPAAQLTAISPLSACGRPSVPRFEGSGRRPNLLPFRLSRHAGTPRSLASKGRAGGPTYCLPGSLDMRVLLGHLVRNVRWYKALSFRCQSGARPGFASLAFCGGQPLPAGLE
ncbi:hypothetical protein SCOR_25075 [Sulfidibacter corallicola]